MTAPFMQGKPRQHGPTAWLVVLAVFSLCAFLLVLALVGRLFKPSGGVFASVLFGLAAWLILATVVAAVIMLVRLRPPVRVSLVVVGVVAILVLCGLPAGVWWTFGVDHGPSGDDCASCAVIDYFATGPLGGYTTDRIAFQRVLCNSHRSQLTAQAAQFASDVRRSTTGTSWGLLNVNSTDEQTTSHEGVTTLTGKVVFTFASSEATYLNVGAHEWRFTLIDRDGWQVCGVAAPSLCAGILRCGAPIPAPTPPASPPETGDPGLSGVYPSNLVPMLPCGPKDPFRQWHSCPPSASPTS